MGTTIFAINANVLEDLKPFGIVYGCAPKYYAHPRHSAIQVINCQCFLVGGSADDKYNNVLWSGEK